MSGDYIKEKKSKWGKVGKTILGQKNLGFLLSTQKIDSACQRKTRPFIKAIYFLLWFKNMGMCNNSFGFLFRNVIYSSYKLK